jgi:hypothetical protein
MALRLRASGEIVCAAMHPKMPGDQYLDDGVHYELSAVEKLLVTERADEHVKRGIWWWRNEVPRGVDVDCFYVREQS